MHLCCASKKSATVWWCGEEVAFFFLYPLDIWVAPAVHIRQFVLWCAPLCASFFLHLWWSAPKKLHLNETVGHMMGIDQRSWYNTPTVVHLISPKGAGVYQVQISVGGWCSCTPYALLLIKFWISKILGAEPQGTGEKMQPPKTFQLHFIRFFAPAVNIFD